MTMNPSQVRVVDPILTTVALGYRNAEHIGHLLFPRVPVYVSAGKVVKFGKEAFMLYNSRRAPGANTKRIEFEYGNDQYSLVQDALEGKVPREWLRDAKEVPGIDLAKRAVNVVLGALSLGLEFDQAKLATDATKYDANHKVTLAGASKWSDDASNPGKTFGDYREAVRSSVGVYPNTLILSPKAFNAARENPQVKDRFKYTSSESVTTAMLANYFDVKRVVVGACVAFNDQGVASDCWGNNAVLAYVPEAAQSLDEPSYGYTYTMDGNPMVEVPYYDNQAKSWIYPVTYERQALMTSMQAGFLIQNPA